MVKKSVVKKVDFKNTWDNKEGKTFFAYLVEMENGDRGEYSSISDSQDKFVEGVEVEYNYSQVGDYTKIKPHYNNPSNSSYSYSNPSNQSDEQIARSVGVKSATEFGIANGLNRAEILETAKIFADFIVKDKVVVSNGETKEVPF